MRRSVLAGVLLLGSSTAWAGDDALAHAVNAPARAAEHRARDVHRHPYETLEFFRVRPDMTVVELWPGGGWYTEILAPYLKSQGKLYAAHFNPDSSSAYVQRSLTAYRSKLAADPDRYGAVEVTVFDPPSHLDIAPPGSVDAVLTFRNLHNWYMRGGGEERLTAAYAGIHRALKPGGLFGVVDHRLPTGRPISDQDSSGYMLQDYVIRTAHLAGFDLLDKSEINANSLDTADHPKGVWTLPPSLRLGAENADRYLTIGESDRMTLLFRKR